MLLSINYLKFFLSVFDVSTGVSVIPCLYGLDIYIVLLYMQLLSVLGSGVSKIAIEISTIILALLALRCSKWFVE